MKLSRPKITSQQIGNAGEQLAETYLCAQGLIAVARNYRCTYGEIDLIMRADATWVFIEVKQRNTTKFGNPAEIVTPSKQKKIMLTAATFVQQQRISQHQSLRFDVVAILTKPGSAPEINWIQHAFQGF